MADDASADFLVVYDYGMGGLWALVSAPSEAAIVEQYPEINVVTERPKWMDDKRFHGLDRLALDDDPPQSILRVVVADRDRK
jgi:hypothetical protein